MEDKSRDRSGLARGRGAKIPVVTESEPTIHQLLPSSHVKIEC